MSANQTTALPEEGAPETRRKRVWLKRLGWLIGIIMLPILFVAAFLSSPIGKRFVADQIATVAPASGLRFEVGRIEGDIYASAVLHDVAVSDPNGVFLRVPEIALDWRPLNWLWSGLDIREITARRGRLERLPELLPGDPDAPILPDFDIRIDRLAIEDLVLAKGLATDDEERADFLAKVDIRSGRALVDAEGALGPEDTIDLLLDAEPDGDRFDLALDYRAADDGPIAGLTGLTAGYEARIAGEGSWTRWLGHGLVLRQSVEEGQAPVRVAAFEVSNDAGTYGLLGQIEPTLSDRSTLDRALGDAVSLVLTGTLEESVFEGRTTAISDALDLRGEGVVDFAGNRFDGFAATARLRDPQLFGSNLRLADAQLFAELNGSFRDLSIPHRITVSELETGPVLLRGLAQESTARFDGTVLTVPMAVAAERVVTGAELVDPRLVSGTLSGTLRLGNGRLDSDNAVIAFPDLSARLALRGDLSAGAYALAGPVNARAMVFENIGSVTAESKLLAKFGTAIPWSIRANLAGALSDVSNATLANVAGEELRFRGAFGMAGDQPIILRDVELESERLIMALDSRISGERTSIAGNGSHTQYGAFTLDAEWLGVGPRATLVLADPYSAAGLEDVRVAFAPDGDGFALDIAGGSLLGPFEGTLGLALPGDAPTRIAIERLEVFETRVSGGLNLRSDGVAGDLALSGGGLNGTLALAPRRGGAQGFDLDLRATRARFGGDTAIALAEADIDASGYFRDGSSRIDADISGKGFEYGALTIASFAAKAAVVDGRGDVTAAIAGRRSDRFALKFDGDIAPDRIALLARGEYAGRSITMPRRAVLTAEPDGGWRLAPTQIGFARGFAILEGALGAERTRIEAQLASMPLRLADLAGAELGLGGRLSGLVTWDQRGTAHPTANARVRIDDFSRSGLVLSSKPIDVFAVADLSADRLTVGARLRADDDPLGRLDARITRLGGGSDLVRRIMRGRLDAKLAYEGAAESLWRLAAIETFDLTGPLSVDASARGTLDNPRITGNLASDSLRLQSAISGTDVSDITARGRFAGSRLELTRFAGSTRGGGTVSGSGTVNFANMSGARGPAIDIRLAASDARLLAASGLDATLTGPLRIVSNGVGGAIAGRVRIDRASWQLGIAAEDMALPRIATREINQLDTARSAARSTVTGSWRYLVDAAAPSRVEVDGMGLDSEWGIDIALRGTVNDPRIGGEARLVRGAYTFAGTRFDLTEGRIAFDAAGPIDPRLDIAADTSANGTNVTVAITGNAQSPEVAFSSEPSLPEEEILAQLLFGGSVTSLSATDAVQLAAALAALNDGGGGIDPIGDLRRSIGLDQLRIVSADPAIGRETGIALGKNVGRRVFIEIITDGRGYSATSVEYRVTRWLALLGTVSTIGRDSVLAEISRDY